MIKQQMNDVEMWCRECRKRVPCRFAPSPDAGPHWRCSECGEVVEGRPPVASGQSVFVENARADAHRLTRERDEARALLREYAEALSAVDSVVPRAPGDYQRLDRGEWRPTTVVERVQVLDGQMRLAASSRSLAEGVAWSATRERDEERARAERAEAEVELLRAVLRWRGCSVRDDHYAHHWCRGHGGSCPAWSVPLARCTALGEPRGDETEEEVDR